MQLKAPLAVLGAAAFLVTAQVSAEGNRYDRDRYYHSEISVAQAYLAMEHSKDFKNIPGLAKPVLVDVRTLREYAGGHPEDAYNIPFPNITGFAPEQTQDPVKFYWMVYDLVGGDLNRPVMLLCRTGSRSIAAGNLLANPESNAKTAGMGLQPFTNVRNVWEGYVGLNLYAFNGNPLGPDRTKPLDLNNDGVINADTADVHAQTTDANPDKDGWRNFAGLPWTTQIQRPLAYQRDPGLYKKLNLTPVQ
ncbi:MAG: rhodanese-like domain-containing protein [Thiobacillaceae bacterium]|jgi:rhodanese-related sulfurtransferase|nr:rhodanese-like domain-containing protein [Thiobacillaceae bacterium]